MAALSEGQIRLLHFQDGSSEDAIQLELRTYNRAEVPAYTALSYGWGRPKNPGSIRVNGVARGVRRNLCDALKHLPSHTTGPFWVDAICIDQKNAKERNDQVRAMGEIYSGAALVLAWLGLVDDNIRPCFASNGQESLAVVRAARKALVGRQYWTRLWVYQELVLAKQIRITCGHYSMGYSDLETLLWNVDADYDAQRICYAVSRGPTYDLCEALAQFSTCKCADERDRIFAVLSIVKEDQRVSLLRILPLYSTPVPRLVEAAREHINELRSRDVVSYELFIRASTALTQMHTGSIKYSQAVSLEPVDTPRQFSPQIVDPAFNPAYAPLQSPRPRDAADMSNYTRDKKAPMGSHKSQQYMVVDLGLETVETVTLGTDRR
ncbi:hypothetical protein LTR95_009024 [Oleoguttula sp. CCFEE 5521]